MFTIRSLISKANLTPNSFTSHGATAYDADYSIPLNLMHVFWLYFGWHQSGVTPDPNSSSQNPDRYDPSREHGVNCSRAREQPDCGVVHAGRAIADV